MKPIKSNTYSELINSESICRNSSVGVATKSRRSGVGRGLDRHILVKGRWGEDGVRMGYRRGRQLADLCS